MPTYRYTIKKGYEDATFSEQGIKRLSPTEVEADHELHNPLLTPVEAKEPAPKPSAAPAAPAPAPAQPPTPPATPAPAISEPPAANKESEKPA